MSNARQKMRDLESRYSASAHAPTASRLNGSAHNTRLTKSAHNGADLNRVRVNRPGMVKQASARPGMVRAASARPGMARAASARPGMTPASSARAGMGRQASRPNVIRQTSAPVVAKQPSKAAVKAILTKAKSKKKLEKEKSKKELKKEKSKKKLEKGKSKKELKKGKSIKKAELVTQPSRGNLNRTPSGRQLNRTPSRGNIQRTPSRGDLKRQGSRQQSFKKRPSVSRTNSTNSQQEFANFRRRRRDWKKFQKVEERPKKSLVIVWMVVLAELTFDFGTTIIAFRAMLQEDDCCGQPLNLGPLPLSVATPFIFLIVLELLILVRAIVLTLWPSILDQKKREDSDGDVARTWRNGWRLCVCNCFRFTVKTLLQIINVLVLLNPWFACIIAWMLLYQSDKNESFIVLGLEGASIILHFISVKLEGSVKNLRQFLFHSIPLIPFLASVTLVLVYLKQEGVCYIVAQAVFQFEGCEICPNGYPPIDGNCILDNGTVVAIDGGGFLNLGDGLLNNPGDLTKATAAQATFCGNEHDGWDNNTAFCFFGYDGDD